MLLSTQGCLLLPLAGQDGPRGVLQLNLAWQLHSHHACPHKFRAPSLLGLKQM